MTRALGRARGEDLLTRLDDGLETQLGKSYADGTDLSGGQWQKLALGRAMMRETPLLLILDEPTSALDAQAEHNLFEEYAAAAQARRPEDRRRSRCSCPTGSRRYAWRTSSSW